MKLCVRSLSLTSTIVLAFAALTACSPRDESNGPRSYQIPWPTSSGDYEIQTVEIKTFTQPAYLRGDLLEIFIAPSSDGTSLSGGKAVGRFIEKSDGTRVPADLISLQATTMYAHFERLHEIDVSLGIDSAFMWPAKAGIKVNYMDANGSVRDNAVYDSALNAVIMVPYTSTQLPLTLNAGVIAHEHFHSIFEDRVNNFIEAAGHKTDDLDEPGQHVCAITDKPAGTLDTKTVVIGPGEKLSRKATPREYNQFLLRALNEGLADYWGWMYTGDNHFISRSLEKVGRTRSLDQRVGMLWSTESVRSMIRNGGSKLGRAYDVGIVYARFLRGLAIAQSSALKPIEESKMEVARAMMTALSRIQKDFSTGFEAKFVAPEVFITYVFDNLETVEPESCTLYSGFVHFGDPPASCKATPVQQGSVSP